MGSACFRSIKGCYQNKVKCYVQGGIGCIVNALHEGDGVCIGCVNPGGCEM